MSYETLFTEATNLVNRLIGQRDSALEQGDLIAAKIKDSEAREAARAFFSATEDSRFADREISRVEQIEQLTADARTQVLSEDSWSALAKRLQKAKEG